MSDPTPASSTKKKDPHYFRIGTTSKTYYEIQLIPGNYDQLLTVVGLTKTRPTGNDVNIIEMSIAKAVKEGLLFPLKVKGKDAAGKAKGARIIVVRDKIEEAFTQARTKSYGNWKIETVHPIMKRLITV